MNQEKIRNEAKALMDEFMIAIESVPNVKEDVGIERKHFVRKPDKCEFTTEFSERMLKNAPAKKGNFLVAEKKKW